jgi:hypothetical protein
MVSLSCQELIMEGPYRMHVWRRCIPISEAIIGRFDESAWAT